MILFLEFFFFYVFSFPLSIVFSSFPCLNVVGFSCFFFSIFCFDPLSSDIYASVIYNTFFFGSFFALFVFYAIFPSFLSFFFSVLSFHFLVCFFYNF